MAELSYTEAVQLLGRDLAAAWNSDEVHDAILKGGGVPPVVVSRVVEILEGFGLSARLELKLSARLLADG